MTRWRFLRSLSLALTLAILFLLDTATSFQAVTRTAFYITSHRKHAGRRFVSLTVRKHDYNKLMLLSHQSSSPATTETNKRDLWNADISLSSLQQQQQQNQLLMHGHTAKWKSPSSSILPLPEQADDPSIAMRARDAISKAAPLNSRCMVNLNPFNNNNGRFCKAQWLHVDPPVFIVDDFLTETECNEVMRLTISPPPAGVGRVIKIGSRLSESNKSNHESTAVRLSTTWYVRFGSPQVAPLLRGVLQLLPNIRLEQVEEIQLVQYLGEGQGFGWHEDALSREEATLEVGGQRIATLLVYLDDECQDGSGRTLFRDLLGHDGKRLGVVPKKGRALLFFPAITETKTDTGSSVLSLISTSQDSGGCAFGDLYFDNTRADHRTTHAGEPPKGGNRNNAQKHIAQLWIHSRAHTPVVFGRGLNKHSEAKL